MGKALFRNSCQRGLLTIFSSTGSQPLSLWDLHIQNGYYKRYMDPQIRSMMFEIAGNNVSTAYMTCPKGTNVLGIVMPYLVMVVKNLHKYWSFEITILDDDNVRRRFRASNFQSSTQINVLNTAMPICLADGWNQIQFNLADFTNRAYARRFCEVQKVKINANIGIRRIYFAERLMPDHELPMEYKLYLPLSGKPRKKIATTTGANQVKIMPSMMSAVAQEASQSIATIAAQEIIKKAGEVLHELQKTTEKGRDTKLDEQKASHSKGSVVSNVSAPSSVRSKASVAQPEVLESKHSLESKLSAVGSKTSKQSDSKITGEIDENDNGNIPAEPEENDEDDPRNTPAGSQGSIAKDLSPSPRRLEDLPEENEEALVE